jgi:hypothetical protein
MAIYLGNVRFEVVENMVTLKTEALIAMSLGSHLSFFILTLD